MSVNLALKQMFRFFTAAICFAAVTAMAQNWQEIAKFEEGRQELVFEFNPQDRSIRMSADKGGFFSRTHRKEFSVSTSESLRETLQKIQDFLEKEHFSEKLYPIVNSRLSQFQYLTVAECRAIHMPLSRPLSESSVTNLLEEIEKMDSALRAPANSVQSLKVTEIQLNGETVDLHLSLDSQGQPTGVGLIKAQGDFRELQISSEDGIYSLYDSSGEWVLDVVLIAQANETISNAGQIEIELRRPTEESSLSDVERDLLLLKSRSGRWQTSRGHEGVNDETYREEAQQLLREYDALELSSSNQESMEDWLAQCKVYESQIQLSSLDQGYFCRELAAVHVSFYKGLDQIEGDVAQSTYKERYRNCLVNSDVAEGNPLRLKLETKSLEDMEKIGRRCQENAYRPYARDQLVSQLLEEDVVSSVINTDELKQSFSEILHEKAFEFCEQEDLPLESEKCREKVNLVKHDQVFNAKISGLLSTREDLSQEQAENVGDSIVEQWTKCLGEKASRNCAEEVLLNYAKEYSRVADFNLDEFSSELRISLDEYAEWRDLFREEFNSCLELKTQRARSFDELMASYSFFIEDCREEAGMAIFPNVYEMHLSKSVFSHLSESRPEVWQELIHETSRDLSERISHQEISHKGELREQFSRIVTGDMAKLASDYLERLVEDEEISETQLESLRQMYSLDKSEKHDWSGVLSSLFERREIEDVEVLLNDFFLNIERSALRSEIESSSLESDDKQLMDESVHECMDGSPNAEGENFGRLSVHCRKKLLGQEMFLRAKSELEQVVSEHFSLTGEKANGLLSPIWYMNRCKDEVPIHTLSQEDYLARVQACLDLARMDTYELLMDELIKKNESLMSSLNRESPAITSRYCLQSIFLKMSRVSDESDLKDLVTAHSRAGSREDLSIYEIQRERLQSAHRRPLLSRLFPEEHLANDRAEQDARQLRSYLEAMQNHPEFRGDWMKDQLDTCLEQTQEVIYMALRESFIQNSDHFRSREANSQGETDVQVIRHILDDELIGLVLEMRDQRAGPSRGHGLAEIGGDVTADFTFEALSRAQQVISEKLAQGFIFDRDRLKTELIIFRDQLKEGLRWMNMSSQDVSINELANFFESSQLADVLAYAEISSMVFDRFSDFLKEMKDAEMDDFERQVGHRPLWRLSAEEKQIRSEIIQRYRRLEELAHEMTSSYDFRRIIHQNDSKGRELLGLLKRHFLLAQVTGREVSAEAFDRTWELMGELIIEDKTPGGFAERFVGEMAQSHLDQQKDSKWAITKALFYDDEDFDWDELRKTSSGRRALNYYTRYLLWPKVMGREMSGYLKQLRRSEFERYLSDAQDEN